MKGKILIELDTGGDGQSKDPFIEDEDKFTVEELIPRILLERKSFLNILEASLEEEIEKSRQNRDGDECKDGYGSAKEGTNSEFNLNGDEDGYDGLNAESGVSLVEKFQRQKLDLARCINSALNETSLSLDFVSLMISAVKPSMGKSTMSPHLVRSVPLGSLNSDRLANSEETEKDDISEKIGQGWKLESLAKITRAFKEASSMLSEQVAQEKKYWDMINLVLKNDEILYKTKDPSNGSNAIGVRYGFGDSGSSYHDKGLALLKKNNRTGEVTFLPLSNNNKITTKVYKYTKVKILSKIDDDFMLTGQSVFEEDLLGSSEHKIINDIERARFFLFEEDLFYHLTREAKILINYNVLIIGNKIIIELDNQLLEIESVVYDETDDEELKNYYQNINKQSSVNNQKAQSILVFLKLMLCCFYNYNLKLKQKLPTSITKWKQQNSHPLILRPLLGHIRHEINIKVVKEIIDSLEQLKIANLKISSQHQRYKNLQDKGHIDNPFIKSIERPLSRFEIFAENRENKKILKAVVDITAGELFCDLIITLDIIKFDSLLNLTENIDGSNILHMSINDFNDLKESLSWSFLNFSKQ